MKSKLIALLVFILISGCSKKEHSPLEAVVINEVNPSKADRYLAYEHTIRIDADEQKIRAIYEAGQAACREASSQLCTVLESRISNGRKAYASLKFRAKPGGIKLLIAALGNQGDVTEQTTVAEDLAAPIGDVTKKLAMLNDYRSKLEALRGRASADIDALIKVNRELSQVQSELEENTGSHAHLIQRVETEILNVNIGAHRNQSFWSPISNAFSDFGSNLSEGASTAITGIALMTPWALIIFFLSWVGRKLWFRWKRAS